MGVFKKLTGADVRVTPIRVKYNKTSSSADITAAYNNTRAELLKNSNNTAILHKSLLQLYYGAFFDYNWFPTGSVVNKTHNLNSQISDGGFSRYDPSFQGSGTYSRTLGVSAKVRSLDKRDFGNSIVPGTVSGSGFTDDKVGNLKDSGGDVVGNVFYDQGILVRNGSDALGTVEYQGSYTIYATQYKCTADPHEFNYTLNPSILSGSEYDSSIVESADFMPYVTTIGLYNENQELMMVAKLARPVKLNPYVSTNFIVRLDR